MASSNDWIPLFLNAVPHVTGTIMLAIVAFLRAPLISSSPKNFSINSSLVSTTDSNMNCLASSAFSTNSALISFTSNFCPLSESIGQIISFIVIRSITPSK